MKGKTVLVIDDSATIRRLVDGELSSAGYHVLMAPNAEDGVETARGQNPDLIILDHQLPGTTGYDVCCQLLSIEETAKIPVVASSTLRKKAYAEYLECDNVVDMLPKPYTPEALIATVENAINTAELVVNSQCDGSAVPEVIDALGESALAGAFGCFGLREIVDLLNNGTKSGVLEVETENCRVSIFVGRGRIQAVTASGIDPSEVAARLPEALSELAPVVKFTVAGRRGSEVDGLVELLNNKVLDPRLLQKLLRLQAAVLLQTCFSQKLKSFRFDDRQSPPSLFEKLPLECSLLALLVEGTLIVDINELPNIEEFTGYTRKAIRGQNLDRAGLSSRHMKMMNMVSEPASLEHIADRLGWSQEEARRVLYGFELAELVERCSVANTTKVFGVVSDESLCKTIVGVLNSDSEYTTKISKDWLALRLMMRRQRPDVLLVELGESTEDQLKALFGESEGAATDVRVIGFSPNPDQHNFLPDVLPTQCTGEQLMNTINAVPAI